MERIEELEKYLEDECYSERGINKVIKSFSREKDLVEYAYEKLSANKWNKAHLVARVWSECEILQAGQDLQKNDIYKL